MNSSLLFSSFLFLCCCQLSLFTVTDAFLHNTLSYSSSLSSVPSGSRTINSATKAPNGRFHRVKGSAYAAAAPYSSQKSNPYREELMATAAKIAGKGRGILASDESNATTGIRLNSVDVENTEENRRRWREVLYTAPDLGKYISGCIMFEETLYQKTGNVI